MTSYAMMAVPDNSPAMRLERARVGYMLASAALHQTRTSPEFTYSEVRRTELLRRLEAQVGTALDRLWDAQCMMSIGWGR